MKQTIRLTESKLRSIIRESVKKCLYENYRLIDGSDVDYDMGFGVVTDYDYGIGYGGETNDEYTFEKGYELFDYVGDVEGDGCRIVMVKMDPKPIRIGVTGIAKMNLLDQNGQIVSDTWFDDISRLGG